MSYAELQVITHFSFLRGASSPEELVESAARMGMPALGITDRNSVAGVVRALVASEQIAEQWGHAPRLIAGCRIDLVDGASLLVWPEDRPAWSRLTTLLSIGKCRANAQKGEKGQCFLHWEDVAGHAAGLVAALVPGRDGADPVALGWMADLFGSDRGHVCLIHQRRPGDAMRLHHIERAARHYGLTPIATGDVLYHTPEQRVLHDVVTAIREKCTIDDLGHRRERSADRHLKPPEEMARRFRDHPDALAATQRIVERCTFSLRELRHQYPDERVMTHHSPQKALEKMAWRALNARFDGRPAQAYRRLLTRELGLVRHWGYAAYFLTAHSIVEYARSQDILCQGRGSAANSVICFVLGITSIDPVRHKLLFERFLSEDRREPPDIDVDFEHDRREEVIQWIYDSYGRDHAALTAVVSRFRTRGAIREVGKVMGLSEDVTAALAKQVWGWSNDAIPDEHVAALNLDKAEPRLALTLELAQRLVGTPRHLSQHPGGFVLTRDPLFELMPIEPAAMADRHVIEWEKDDIEEMGFMKVDILGLGMLGCMRRAFDLLAEHKRIRLTLDHPVLQREDTATYDMMCRADTLGVFQIESRAQMSMLPRMRPRNFYDVAIQVAIVRPGPIQGDMVHPYLKRRELKRAGHDDFDYPNPKLRSVLEKTLGVPLFQEQAMQVAIIGAGFSPSQADQLRRAMATFKQTGGVGEFRDKLIAGMRKNGISEEFAERLVKQIEGFGSYGFPESHAAGFAKIAYASSWMKCHHPDVFCAALLNAQPMGFYAPAQIVRDAREHGVEICPVCISTSEWDTTLEAADGEKGRHPLRLGLRIVTGLAAADAARILIARGEQPFTSIEDVWRRSGVKAATLEKLAQADAFAGLGLDRRRALWAIRGLGERPPPLLALLDTREPDPVLAPLTAGREVVEDYRATQLSLRAHPLSFLRAELEHRGAIPCAALDTIRDGGRVEVAGLVLVRQRPGSARGVLFVTIEDESGIANAILWPDRFEANRRTVMSSAMLGIAGRVQKESGIIHVIIDRLTDLTPLLRQVGDIDLPRISRGDGATCPGSPDNREPEWRPRGRSDYHWRDRGEDMILVRSHDFH
ncbi:error-prone DNA polymerase [Stakelama saccharophila]|uniref:Error-prone DNA polymerase n=1 Tax=Stakelama saccharophila TaxID=3075605 RepID=A0ABZ0B6B9_9SPHN|nr:error-prone DNA polymerase [Stakelama sp. W311]WNO52433.1 error-prone DNA polymerase [Stakelama sp. W311]